MIEPIGLRETTKRPGAWMRLRPWKPPAARPGLERFASTVRARFGLGAGGWWGRLLHRPPSRRNSNRQSSLTIVRERTVLLIPFRVGVAGSMLHTPPVSSGPRAGSNDVQVMPALPSKPARYVRLADRSRVEAASRGRVTPAGTGAALSAGPSQGPPWPGGYRAIEDAGILEESTPQPRSAGSRSAEVRSPDMGCHMQAPMRSIMQTSSPAPAKSEAMAIVAPMIRQVCPPARRLQWNRVREGAPGAASPVAAMSPVRTPATVSDPTSSGAERPRRALRSARADAVESKPPDPAELNHNSGRIPVILVDRSHAKSVAKLDAMVRRVSTAPGLARHTRRASVLRREPPGPAPALFTSNAERVDAQGNVSSATLSHPRRRALREHASHHDAEVARLSPSTPAPRATRDTPEIVSESQVQAAHRHPSPSELRGLADTIYSMIVDRVRCERLARGG